MIALFLFLHISMFRIKKLDGLIIKSFIGPFLITFFVVLVTFVLQFYWLYMDELMGKGFSPWLTIQLLFYTALTIIPMVLPLGILLASIMTFGNLGENMELVAIKSSGISLFRFMRPLFVFILLISIAAFYFNNYVIPVINLKTYALTYDMRNQKPTMNLSEGRFNNDLDGFSIRIGKKHEDGSGLKDIIIYDHSQHKGNIAVILADSGRMYMTNSGRELVLEMYDGWRYESNPSDSTKQQNRMYFAKWSKNFDMSSFMFERTKEELFKDNEEMMNVRQLNQQIDSASKLKENALLDLDRYIDPYYYAFHPFNKDTSWISDIGNYTLESSYEGNYWEHIPLEKRQKIDNRIKSNLESMKRLVSIVQADQNIYAEKIKKYKIQWHDKYTLTFACILLFLIGAPFGAIIRKGGIGVPLLTALGFFVVYFIVTSTGKKLAEQNAVEPWYGLWLATFILLPIAVFILFKAKNDSQILNRDGYIQFFKKIKNVFTRENKIS